MDLFLENLLLPPWIKQSRRVVNPFTFTYENKQRFNILRNFLMRPIANFTIAECIVVNFVSSQ